MSEWEARGQSEQRLFPHFHGPSMNQTSGPVVTPITVPCAAQYPGQETSSPFLKGTQPPGLQPQWTSFHALQRLHTPGLVCWVSAGPLGLTHTWVSVDDSFALNELGRGKADLQQPRHEVHVSVCELLEHVEEELGYLLALALDQVQNFADLVAAQAGGCELALEVPSHWNGPHGRALTAAWSLTVHPAGLRCCVLKAQNL